jgi:hypothetical protein
MSQQPPTTMFLQLFGATILPAAAEEHRQRQQTFPPLVPVPTQQLILHLVKIMLTHMFTIATRLLRPLIRNAKLGIDNQTDFNHHTDNQLVALPQTSPYQMPETLMHILSAHAMVSIRLTLLLVSTAPWELAVIPQPLPALRLQP